MASQIIGHLKERSFLDRLLKPGVEGRTLHLTGPSKLGKRWCALHYALKLRGEGENERERVLRGDHPDITLFSPEGKMALHPAEAVREVIDRCREAPYQGPYKVLIVDGAERMQGVSSNTLLKTLEEPLKTTFIFLVSERKEKILPTILSRSIEITFSPIPRELLLPELKGEGKISAELAALLSRGSLSRAKELYSEGLPEWRSLLLPLLESPPATYFTFRDQLKKITEPLVALKEDNSLRFYQIIHDLLESIVGWFRDLHLLRHGGQNLFFPDQLPLLKRRLERGNLPSITKVLEATAEAHLALERSNSLQTTLESLLLQL